MPPPSPPNQSPPNPPAAVNCDYQIQHTWRRRSEVRSLFLMPRANKHCGAPRSTADPSRYLFVRLRNSFFVVLLTLSLLLLIPAAELHVGCYISHNSMIGTYSPRPSNFLANPGSNLALNPMLGQLAWMLQVCRRRLVGPLPFRYLLRSCQNSKTHKRATWRTPK